MRPGILILSFFILVSLSVKAQDPDTINVINEQRFESLAERTDATTQDDGYWQNLRVLHKNKLSVNSATEEDLASLHILTVVQIKNLIAYRRVFGKLESVYELQAVPGWDLQTIQQILSYVDVSSAEQWERSIGGRLKGGDHEVLLRMQRELQISKGYEQPADTTASYFLGNPYRMLLRYKYNYRNTLQYGMTADKDAGEQFFRGAQKKGFDFYSAHFFVRDVGVIKSLALGDFTVNMGQGLIQWQSLSFTKTSDVLAIKRQASVLRPYNSAGEFNFNRGAGITISAKQFEITAFASKRNLSANLNQDSTELAVVSSFDQSGYHRTSLENARRNMISQISGGASIRYAGHDFHIAGNGIVYKFSSPLQKRDLPYTLFAATGNYWMNASIDYSFTHAQYHFFGETSVDRNRYMATVNGMLISLGRFMDVAVLHRSINKKYRALYNDAFTESAVAAGESGLYTGLTVKPSKAWRVDCFFDIFNFSWLRYRADAPGYGHSGLLQVVWQPSHNWSMYVRYKSEIKPQNEIAGTGALHDQWDVNKQNLRCDFSYLSPSHVTFRARTDLAVFRVDAVNSYRETGFSQLADIGYHFRRPAVKSNFRFQYFETTGYNARIYAYEEDVLYSYSMPSFFGKGYRYYLNADWRLKSADKSKNRKTQVHLSLRWAETVYQGVSFVGSGLDQTKGNRRSDISAQLYIGW